MRQVYTCIHIDYSLSNFKQRNLEREAFTSGPPPPSGVRISNAPRTHSSCEAGHWAPAGLSPPSNTHTQGRRLQGVLLYLRCEWWKLKAPLSTLKDERSTSDDDVYRLARRPDIGSCIQSLRVASVFVLHHRHLRCTRRATTASR